MITRISRALFRIALASLVAASALAQAPLVTNFPGRTTVSLNGSWRAIVDPYQTGYQYRFYNNAKAKDKRDLVEYDFDLSPPLLVPGDWNSQRSNLLFYDGSIWYKKSFNYKKREHTRSFLYFGAANYHAVAFLNGQKLGEHSGGF